MLGDDGRLHERGCPAVADDESDVVLADYMVCVCDASTAAPGTEKGPAQLDVGTLAAAARQKVSQPSPCPCGGAVEVKRANIALWACRCGRVRVVEDMDVGSDVPGGGAA